MFSLKLSFHIIVFELFARKNPFCCPNIRSTLSFLVSPKYILCCREMRCRTHGKMVVWVYSIVSHLLNVGRLTFAFLLLWVAAEKIHRRKLGAKKCSVIAWLVCNSPINIVCVSRFPQKKRLGLWSEIPSPSLYYRIAFFSSSRTAYLEYIFKTHFITHTYIHFFFASVKEWIERTAITPRRRKKPGQ